MEKTEVVQDADFEAAARRGAQRLKKGTVAVAARYDQQVGRVVIELDCGLEVALRPQHEQGLEAAAPAHLSEIEISPSGQGLYFPMVDADLYLPALLKDLLGYKTRLATLDKINRNMWSILKRRQQSQRAPSALASSFSAKGVLRLIRIRVLSWACCFLEIPAEAPAAQQLVHDFQSRWAVSAQ